MALTHAASQALSRPHSTHMRAAHVQLAPVGQRVARKSSISSINNRSFSIGNAWMLGMMGCSAVMQLMVHRLPPQPPVQVIVMDYSSINTTTTATSTPGMPIMRITGVSSSASTLDIPLNARQLTSAQVLSALQAGQVDDAALCTWVNSRLEISQELKDKFYWHQAGLRQLQQLAKTEKKLGGGGAVHQVPSRVDVKGARRSETTEKVLQALCNGLVNPKDVLDYLNGRKYLTYDMYKKMDRYNDALEALSDLAEQEKKSNIFK